MENIEYKAISKGMTKKFKKSDYVLDYEVIKDGVLTFVKGTVLKFGYLQASLKLGAPRGWYKANLSQFPEDFEKEYNLQAGTIKVKINE